MMLIAFLAPAILGVRGTSKGSFSRGLRSNHFREMGYRTSGRPAVGSIWRGGCRILVRSPDDAKLNLNGIVSDYLKRRVLLRHDDLWSADGAPTPSEVTVRYSAGSLRLQPTGSVPDLVRPILQKLQRLEFNGKECRGIKLPNDSYGAYIDLDGIGMIVVGPSLSWMVLGEPPKF
jgi:hypothetical protein